MRHTFLSLLGIVGAFSVCAWAGLLHAASIAPGALDAGTQPATQKVDIMVGFRGLRSVTGGRNPSDGVDSATQRFGGTPYEYSDIGAAYQFIMQRRGSNPNATIAIVGHSAGANSAIRLARQLEGQGVRVTALVVADPGSSSAGAVPGNVRQAVGLFSNSPAYAGVSLRGNSPITNVKYPNLDHFGIDNKIEAHMPFIQCADDNCRYSGNANCTYDQGSGKYNCTSGPAPAQNQQQTPPPFAPTQSSNTPTSSPSGSPTSSGSGTNQSSVPQSQNTGVQSGYPAVPKFAENYLKEEPKTKDQIVKDDTKKDDTKKGTDPFEVTPKKTGEVFETGESTNPDIAFIECSQQRIRFSCKAPATSTRALSKPGDTRWKTKGALKGGVTIRPLRPTLYEVRCVRNRVIIAKASCSVKPHIIEKETK